MRCLDCNIEKIQFTKDDKAELFLLPKIKAKNGDIDLSYKNGLRVNVFICSSCGEFSFRAPKE